MGKYNYVKLPESIEHASFNRIDEIIKENFPAYQFNNNFEEHIIKRAIYTTADFDYLNNIQFSNQVIDKIIHVIRNKGTIYTDTSMVLSGINKKVLDNLGVTYCCKISDEEIIQYSKKNNVTRTSAAVDFAAKDNHYKIFVFGGAPTAIYRALELYDEKQLHVDAIIGVPSGFIGVEESKEALHQSDIPSITTKGLKGGSNVAASLLNAILYQLENKTDDYNRYIKK